MKKLLIIITICLVQLGYTQREANIWHFGDGVGLDFNSCEPEVIFSEMSSSEGCTSISDSFGELQFYTEGSTIWNRNHEVMTNGTNLLGFRSATQASMIVKRPGNFNEYYVFTVDTQDYSNGLMYSKVDMNSDGGLGAVVLKNIPLVTPIAEKIHATRHANGVDVWVSVHGFGNNNFYSFLVTSAGVNSTPVVSSVGPIISGDELATIGAMKFSPNGKKLAICNYENGVDLFDFNDSNGLFSNSINVTPRLYSYGVEFSKSNNILYVTTSYQDIDNKLLQYDLRASKIEDSEILLLDLADKGSIGSLQLGPDHKLYVSINNRNFLSVINNPDKLGLSCNFIEDSIDLGEATAKRGLPLFLSPFFHNRIVVDSACYGSATFFSLDENLDNIVWDFGDPASGINNISTESEPTHIFSAPGVYNITTSIPSGCGSTPFLTEQIEIFSVEEVLTSAQLIQCDDDSDGFSNFNLNEANSKLSPNYTDEIFTYYNTEDDALKEVNSILNTDTYENINAYSDSIWVRVENSIGCFEVIELDLIVSNNTLFETFQPIEINLCDDNKNDGITMFDFSSAQSSIEALFPGLELEITYYINLEDALAETNNIININSYENINSPFSQDIYVRVEDKINNDCLGISNCILLTVSELPEFELVSEAEICLNENSDIVLQAFNANDVYFYEWTNSNGDIISTSIEAIINEPDLYALTATSNNGCKSLPKQVLVSVLKKVVITLEMITINDGLKNNTIIIDETQLGTGDYEYALDDKFGFYQEEPFFQNVTSGNHILYVREKNICEPSYLEFSIIGYPKYFTPNNDGYNDTWNIKGLTADYNLDSKIYIYDRYGKLLKQISPWDNGWDGLFNGEALKPSDYWFVANLINKSGSTRKLTGHFSLLR
ncbi:T9SS type B sorting domain-containing protein [Sabulilitoribacter multivorans]|uniref:T9SS type B sorting domain-containing protein n=1 Tax=Flaviramulus multivorans TaxID=1304750 RepID=A0ABS9ILF7_9FLAO|nr:T9SS type B sorting domain-containing protein [Flaviramulus multivorans]MCF7561402.1 T9SS type B sorting domain-containing protein [Flaviramulus multivorans]